jgi:large subunit ribosomal protein L15
MQLNTLKRNTKQRDRKIVGRGGKRGKTSGRGMKGQKSRAGGSGRPEMRDTIKKLPKMRGRGVNSLKSIQGVNAIVTLASIEKHYRDGDEVSPQSLAEKGLIRQRGGKTPNVKVLAGGELSVKVSVARCGISESARGQVVKAGGKVV